jgi:hypothetical protein
VYAGIAEHAGPLGIIALGRPVPDPMRGIATIRFSLAHRTQANVTIRSATGSLLRVLLGCQSLAPGNYSLSWDGCDERGRRVAPGIYFWRLEGEATSLTRKAIKID